MKFYVEIQFVRRFGFYGIEVEAQNESEAKTIGEKAIREDNLVFDDEVSDLRVEKL